MMLSLDTAYRSFGGEVEASSTPTICRLPDSRRHQLSAIAHVLRWAFFNLKKRAAPGADGLTWTDYAANLDRNLTDLHARVHSGAYRALQSRPTYIPKADGKQRPLGIAALEDKIVQAAVVAILTPIYEAEFLGFNYGFRP